MNYEIAKNHQCLNKNYRFTQVFICNSVILQIQIKTFMKNKFSWRAFISFGLTWSFFIIFFTGIILYISPPGRYANWVTWKIFALTKSEWQALHTVFSFTFVILSILHLFIINWKVFLNYIKARAKVGLNKKRELIISSAIILIFCFGTLFSVTPFSSVMILGENLKGSWEKTKNEPPVPHAELLTLVGLAQQLKYSSAKEITDKFKNHAIVFTDTLQTLKEIALQNRKTPNEIYNLITSTGGGSGRQGSGVGRKTVEDFAVEVNKNTDEVLKIFKNNGIEAEKGQTLKQIGDNNNIPPRDLYEMISK
jgi:succinate dehydrogenase hydrophobic anchor subunit